MKASLIFLDSPTESAIGMIRGIIAFLALVLSFWILRAAVERNSNEILPRGWCVTFIALAMCSLIGISKPDSEKIAFILGIGFGLVVFASVFAFANSNFSSINLNELLLLAFLILMSGFASLLVYITCWKSNRFDWWVKTLNDGKASISSSKNLLIQFLGFVLFFVLFTFIEVKIAPGSK